jgi:hypothetical protein
MNHLPSCIGMDEDDGEESEDGEREEGSETARLKHKHQRQRAWCTETASSRKQGHPKSERARCATGAHINPHVQ